MRRTKPRKEKAKSYKGTPLGRPSGYEPDHHPMKAIKLGKMGKSRAQIAANFGVGRSQISKWEDKYPEFAEAMTSALDFALAWWEDQGQKGIWAGSNFNNGAFSLQIRNRFKEDYNETQTINGHMTHEQVLSLLADEDDD